MAQRTHPHAEATYQVIPIDDGSFAVEVSIPESFPAKVSPFATEAAAEAWIAEHRRRMQSEKTSRAAGIVVPAAARPSLVAVGEPASEPPASSSWWDADAAEPEPIEWRQNARGNLWTLIDDMHTAIFHNRYNEEE